LSLRLAQSRAWLFSPSLMLVFVGPIQQRTGNMIQRCNRKIWPVRLTSGRAVLSSLLREGANMAWQYRVSLFSPGTHVTPVSGLFLNAFSCPSLFSRRSGSRPSRSWLRSACATSASATQSPASWRGRRALRKYKLIKAKVLKQEKAAMSVRFTTLL